MHLHLLHMRNVMVQIVLCLLFDADCTQVRDVDVLVLVLQRDSATSFSIEQYIVIINPDLCVIRTSIYYFLLLLWAVYW